MKFVRWVPKQFVEDAKELGFVSHNHSALWVFDLDRSYRPQGRVTQNAVLLRYDFKDPELVRMKMAVQQIDFEDASFKGEKGHTNQVIVKSNEPGAYGIGWQRQHQTRPHVITEYATRSEVADALGIDPREKQIIDKHAPPNMKGWR